VKSQELTQEPGITEACSKPCFNSLRTSASPQCVFDSAPNNRHQIAMIVDRGTQRDPIPAFHFLILMAMEETSRERKVGFCGA